MVNKAPVRANGISWTARLAAKEGLFLCPRNSRELSGLALAAFCPPLPSMERLEFSKGRRATAGFYPPGGTERLPGIALRRSPSQVIAPKRTISSKGDQRCISIKGRGCVVKIKTNFRLIEWRIFSPPIIRRSDYNTQVLRGTLRKMIKCRLKVSRFKLLWFR